MFQRTRVASADAHDDLANVDTGDSAVGLAPSTTHTRLQSIGTSARQHLVDADDVEGVGADAQVEALLARVLDEVLVGADARGLEGLGAQLLILVGDEVDAEREVVDVGTLAAEIKDADLGVGDTAVEPRLGERLCESRVSHRLSLTVTTWHVFRAAFAAKSSAPRLLPMPAKHRSRQVEPCSKGQILTLFLQ